MLPRGASGASCASVVGHHVRYVKSPPCRLLPTPGAAVYGIVAMLRCIRAWGETAVRAALPCPQMNAWQP